MIILGLQTCFGDSSIALHIEGQGTFTHKITQKNKQAEELIGQIDQLLSLHQLTLQDVTAIVVARGPGSFTGVRVGMAAAIGFNIAHGTPVYFLDNFTIIWHAAGSTDNAIALKAGHTDYYFVELEQSIMSIPCVKTAEEIKQYCQKHKKPLLGNYADIENVPDAKDLILAFLARSDRAVVEAAPLYIKSHNL